MLENRPEFVAIWLGLAKLGVITSFINTNLRKSSLLHCITIAKCQAFIYGIEFFDGKNLLILSILMIIIIYYYLF